MKHPFIVCIIDDDATYQFTVTKALKIQNLAKKILIFGDGEAAIRFLADNLGVEEQVPDVIFLDINMPIMDGWQFLEAYVKIKPRIGKPVTIYMVSSSVDPIDVERAKQIGEVSDYIVKPIMPNTLKELMEELDERLGSGVNDPKNV